MCPHRRAFVTEKTEDMTVAEFFELFGDFDLKKRKGCWRLKVSLADWLLVNLPNELDSGRAFGVGFQDCVPGFIP